MSKNNGFTSRSKKKCLVVRGPDAIAAAFGLSFSGQPFEDAVYRFQRAIEYFDIHVFADEGNPWCVYQKDLDEISDKTSKYVIRGMKAIAEALGYWPGDAGVKRVQRAIKTYNLPTFKDNGVNRHAILTHL